MLMMMSPIQGAINYGREAEPQAKINRVNNRRIYRPSAQTAVRNWQLPRVRSSELQRAIAAFWASG
jgi:hypothetical protein